MRREYRHEREGLDAKVQYIWLEEGENLKSSAGEYKLRAMLSVK